MKPKASLGQRLIAAAARRGGRRREAPADPTPPERILVIRLNRLGDLVCTLPLYRTLQANFPNAKIDWLLSNQNAVLAPFLRMKGRCFTFQRSRVRYWLPEPLLRDLQAQKYDLSISVKAGYDSLLAWISMAVNARRRIGFTGRTTQKLEFAYTDPLPSPASHQHQVEKCLALLAPLQLTRQSNDSSLTIPHSARERVRQLMHSLGHGEGQPFAVFQLSSTKRPFCLWPLKHYVELGRRFLTAGIPVYANALPEERQIIEKLCAELGPRTRPACFSDMGEYLAFLASAKLVVGSDGGGIHLASSVGTHTVAFYTESSPVKWKPWQGEHIQFYSENRDVREITPAQVWERLRQSGWLTRTATPR